MTGCSKLMGRCIPNRLLHQFLLNTFKSIITAPPKPSAQTKFILEAMSSKTDEEKGRWEQVMENFDLLFAQMNDLGIIQQGLKKEINVTREEQKLISKQVQANGQAVASLTIRQMEHEPQFDKSDTASSISVEDQHFENVFAGKKPEPKPEPSRKQYHKHNTETLPHHTVPTMQFPAFDGTSPKIWIDKCNSYFNIYKIDDPLKVEPAVLHLQENAAKWWQAYKQGHTIPVWTQFCQLVQDKFGADDFRTAINDLLNLRQTGNVEEYTKAFQAAI